MKLISKYKTDYTPRITTSGPLQYAHFFFQNKAYPTQYGGLFLDFEKAQLKYNKDKTLINFNRMDSIGKELGKYTLNKYRKNDIDLTYDFLYAPPEGVEKFLINNYVRESDDLDLKNFFSSYINSNGIKRILNNLKIWYDTNHDLTIPSRTDSTLKLFKHNDRIRKPHMLYLNMPVEQSYFDSAVSELPFMNFIFMGTKDSKQDPIDFVKAHEYGHALDEYTYNEGQGKALELNTNTNLSTDELANWHDSKVNEKHSDIWGLKYLLYKEGIYDSRGDRDITKEQVELLRKKYPKLRPLRLMTNELVAKQLNLVAYNPIDTSTLYAKKGVKLIKRKI